MLKPLFVIGAILTQFQPSAGSGAYTWPSKRYDQIEGIMFSLSDYNRMGFQDGVKSCGFSSSFQAGRMAAAEWVRTAYHDMATHSVASGSGGLDASIMFELNRDESLFADAFNGTLGFFSGYHNERTSVADLIALGVHIALRSCRGPSLDVRVGRMDATEAGPLGVPQPHEDIKLLTQRFKSAGFNASDMIKMVACGHTLGGTHDIHPNGSATTSSHNAFDTTSDLFDSKVATEYLDNTTKNFLVNGPDAMNHPDLRVFSVDGNVTMKSLAVAPSFQAACKDILTRMIETVPSNVKLSAAVEPIPVKPITPQLTLDAMGRVNFAGDIRVLATGRPTTDMNVSLIYADCWGNIKTSNVIKTVVPTWRDGMGYGFDYAFKYFSFVAVIPPEGISHFNVSIMSSAGQELHTNDGRGFPIDDTVIYQRPQSCLVQTADAQGKWNLTVVAAVHKYRTQPVTFEFIERITRPGIIIPKLSMKVVPMKKWGGTENYTLYTGTHKLLPEQWSSTFDVVSGSGTDRRVDDFNFSGGLPVVCAPFIAK